ncbi:MAG: heliorhodopsin HeR [Thermomicrobiales bacterium]
MDTSDDRKSDRDASGRGLRRDNLIVGLIHLAQVIVLVVLSNDFTLPMTESFLDGPPGLTTPGAPEVIWDLPLGYAVAFFLLLAAIDHLLMAAPGIWEWYSRNLGRGINYARWWEYSVSASLMAVLIAMLTGISDITALIGIFGANAAMIYFGMVMEIFNRPDDKEINWTPYLFGCVAGAVPWIAIGVALIGAQIESDGQVPTFVFGIFVSLFILFNSFAVNMVLQYKRVGKWRDYIFGERAYIVLSLTAKTALAWQIFANTLID